MQAKLGSDAAQFAAEHADRFRPARSKPVTHDFHDNLIELLRLARPVDSPPGESEHDARHRRIFENTSGMPAVNRARASSIPTTRRIAELDGGSV